MTSIYNAPDDWVVDLVQCFLNREACRNDNSDYACFAHDGHVESNIGDCPKYRPRHRYNRPQLSLTDWITHSGTKGSHRLNGALGLGKLGLKEFGYVGIGGLALYGTLQGPRSGIVLLRVRDEHPVSSLRPKLAQM